MVKTNTRPECRPKRHLTAHLGYRLLFLVAVPTVYCLIAAGGRVIENHNFQKQHTGNHYHPRFVSVSSCFIDVRTNTVIAEPSIIKPAFGRDTDLIPLSSHSNNLSLICMLIYPSTKICNEFLAVLIISTCPVHLDLILVTIKYVF
jgi:hypothetical protein